MDLSISNIRKYLSSGKFSIVSIFFLLFFYFDSKFEIVFKTSLEYDELYSWFISTQSWRSAYSFLLSDTQQFLYYTLLKLFELGIGNFTFEYAGRILSLFFGFCAVLSFVKLLKSNISPPFTMVGALLLIFHPLFFYVSTFARPYSLCILLSILIVTKVHEILNNEKECKILLLILCLLLAFTHYLSLVFILSVLISAILINPNLLTELRKKNTALIIIMSLFVYAFFIYYHLGGALINVSWIAKLDFLESCKFLLSIFFKNKKPFFSIVELMSLIFLFIGYIVCLRSEKSFMLKFNNYIVLFYVLLLSLIHFLFKPIFVERYFVFIIPSFILSLTSILNYFYIENRKLTVLYLTVFLIFNFSTNRNFKFEYRAQIKEAFIKLQKIGLSDDERVLCISRPSNYRVYFENYSKIYLKAKCISYQESLVIKNKDKIKKVVILDDGEDVANLVNLNHYKDVEKLNKITIYTR